MLSVTLFNSIKRFFNTNREKSFLCYLDLGHDLIFVVFRFGFLNQGKKPTQIKVMLSI